MNVDKGNKKAIVSFKLHIQSGADVGWDVDIKPESRCRPRWSTIRRLSESTDQREQISVPVARLSIQEEDV